MSASIITHRRPRRAALLIVAAVAALGIAQCSKKDAKTERPAAPADPAQVLYSQGKYSEALPLLETAATGRRTGTLVYQIGFAKGAIEGPDGASKGPLWTEARTLLEKEIAVAGGATLDRLYYLTAISSEQGEIEKMRQYARQAVDTIEKGPDPNALTGEDWFRLARLHEFLQESSEAEAAYRRAASAFARVPAVNPAYEALTLARVGDLEFDMRRFDSAATQYGAALKLVPGLQQVRPFQYGLALLASGRFAESVAVLAMDRNADTVTESQYAADMARKAEAAGGLSVADTDGAPISGMGIDTLDERIKQAGADYRAARVKHSYKTGDPLSPEMKDTQKRFIALLRERLMQTTQVQEFCLKEGLADLVRR